MWCGRLKLRNKMEIATTTTEMKKNGNKRIHGAQRTMSSIRNCSEDAQPYKVAEMRMNKYLWIEINLLAVRLVGIHTCMAGSTATE